jgi:putative Holliday junction resolvase
MRVLGVDLGARRIGLAVSDPSGALARPWKTLPASGPPGDRAAAVLAAVQEFLAQERRSGGGDAPAFGAIVVGFPQRLGGGDTHLTGQVRTFADALAAATGLPVHLQDERLSSREAESRLSVHERDWKKRKAKLDAAAAAIILQDFLDAHGDRRSAVSS